MDWDTAENMAKDRRRGIAVLPNVLQARGKTKVKVRIPCLPLYRIYVLT